jgi:hypothetical protein
MSYRARMMQLQNDLAYWEEILNHDNAELSWSERHRDRSGPDLKSRWDDLVEVTECCVRKAEMQIAAVRGKIQDLINEQQTADMAAAEGCDVKKRICHWSAKEVYPDRRSFTMRLGRGKVAHMHAKCRDIFKAKNPTTWLQMLEAKTSGGETWG